MCDLRVNACQFLRLFYGFLGKDQSKLCNLYNVDGQHHDRQSGRTIRGSENILKHIGTCDFVGKKFHIEEFSLFPVDDFITLSVFGQESPNQSVFIHNFILSPQFLVTASVFSTSDSKSCSDLDSLVGSLDMGSNHSEVEARKESPAVANPSKDIFEPVKEQRGWGPNICPPGLNPPAHGILPKHVVAFSRSSQAAQGENKGNSQRSRGGGQSRQNAEGRERFFGEDHKQLFVGNLPGDIKESVLQNYFSKFGNVLEARVSRSKNHPNSRPFGFIKFDNEESVSHTLAVKNHNLHGHRINVEQKNSNRGDRSEGRDGGRWDNRGDHSSDHVNERNSKKQY